MRYFTVLLVVFAFVSGTAFAHDVTGTVEVMLKGDKPKEDLSTIVVYLDDTKTPEIDPAAPKKDFTLVTKDKQFTPRVMAVPIGATVNFPNYDQIFHNLFSVSNPNQFDLGLYKGGASKTKEFVAPGVVRIFCNVHPQMSATIVVANSGFYTVADKSGSFRLSNVPNGSYILRAYSEEGQAEQKLEMKDTPVKAKLSIDGRNFKKIKHKNKFGKDYSTDDNERY